MKLIHYVIAGLLVCGGVALSVMIIPSDAELALLRFKDKDFANARAAYQQRFEAGELSASVVMPLAQLHLQYGEVASAIEVLEKYLTVYPDDSAAKNMLGKYYQYAQRPYEYRENLESLVREAPTQEALRELSHIYSFAAEFDKQIEALQKLIELFPEQQSDFLDLANLEASQGRFNDAVMTLQKLESHHPDQITVDTIRLLISLHLDSGQPRQAVERARRWLAAHPAPDGAARIAGIIHYKGYPAEALSLLSPFEQHVEQSPALLNELTQLEIKTGMQARALERMRAMFEQKRLPGSVVESYIDLLLTNGDPAAALQVAASVDLTEQPDWLLANLAEAALGLNDSAFLAHLVIVAGEGFLGNFPLLAAEMALVRRDHAAARAWMNRANRAGLDTAGSLALASLYERVDQKADAIRVLRAVVPRDDAPVSAISNLASLYLETGKAGDAVGLFETLRRKGKGIEVETAWARIAASAGKEKEVIQWFSGAPAKNLTSQNVADLYYIAHDGGRHALAALTAERLFGLIPSRENRYILAAALADAGRTRDALPHVRALLEETPSADEKSLYAAVMTKAVQEGEPAKELIQFWAAELGARDIPVERREEIVYALLDLKAFDVALPQLKTFAHDRSGQWLFAFIEAAAAANQTKELTGFLEEELARTDLDFDAKTPHMHALRQYGGEAALPFLKQFAGRVGGEWIFAYEEALEGAGRKQELLEFRVSRALDAKTSREDKLAIAGLILDAGHEAEAEGVFLHVAQNAAPDSDEVGQLLYLWGYQPEEYALDWIEMRARTARRGGIAALWVDHLVDLGAAARAVEVAQDLAAIAEDPDLLRRYGRIALQSGLRVEAKDGYSRLLRLRRGDIEALRALGVLAYAAGDQDEARPYLERYLASSDGDAETHFYFGEILLSDGETESARSHFERSLELAHDVQEPSVRLVRAQVLDRLDRPEESVLEFESLLEESPSDSNVRADYVAVLMRRKNYDDARSVLGSETSLRLDLLRGQLLTLTGDDARALSVFANLDAKYPDQPEVKLNLADTRLRLGQWRRAREGYIAAQGLFESGEIQERLRNSLILNQSSRMLYGLELKTVSGGQTESIAQWSGHQLFGNYFRIGFNAAALQSRFQDRQERVWRTELYGQQDYENGVVFKGSLFGSSSGPGWGAQLARPDSQGRLSFLAEYGRPFWEFGSGLLDGSVRHRIEIRREQQIGGRRTARFGLARNRYGAGPGAAASVGFDGGLMQAFALPNGILTLEYSVDAERRRGANEFPALPLASREVHAVTMAAERAWDERFRASGFYGYSVDRLGGRGSFLGFTGAYNSRRVEAGASFERRMNSIFTGQVVNRYSAYINWRF